MGDGPFNADAQPTRQEFGLGNLAQDAAYALKKGISVEKAAIQLRDADIDHRKIGQGTHVTYNSKPYEVAFFNDDSTLRLAPLGKIGLVHTYISADSRDVVVIDYFQRT